MGVDIRLMLFTRPDVRDVADVLALLDGCKGEWTDIPSFHVPTVKVEPALVGCTNIMWDSPYDGPRCWLWHEQLDHSGLCGSIPRSTAKNIALACSLADFFGGFVQFNDCDSYPHSYVGQPEGVIVWPSNGGMWRAFQDLKSKVGPLEQTYIDYFDVFAAYKMAKRDEHLGATRE